MRKYIVELTGEEKEELTNLTRKGKASARKIKRAQILLLANEGKQDAVISQSLHVGASTVLRIKRKFVLEGLETALKEKPRRGAERKLNGKQEAFLVALACSQPPQGRQGWTMQMLADQLVRLEVVDAISDETVRRTLKKGTSNPGKGKNGVCPK